jgi:outer membrane receptor for ferrienterochelin and colicins
LATGVYECRPGAETVANRGIQISRLDSGVEIFGGVRNITNAYQDDFDTGKNRDSGYIYGPAAPRTFFIGLRLSSL